MNDDRFDSLLHSLAATPSRRGALGLLASSALGLLGWSAAPEAGAHNALKACKKKSGKQKKKCLKKARAHNATHAIPQPPPVCTPGLEPCGNRCVDPGTDTNHCGGCNRRCAFPHAAATCGAGQCQMGVCDAGFADCNGSVADGCEIDTQTDAANCGICGRNCPQAEECCGGACVDIETDPDHCGACNRACATDQTCTSGRCYHPGASSCPAETKICQNAYRCEAAGAATCYCVNTTAGAIACVDAATTHSDNCVNDADCAGRGPDFVCLIWTSVCGTNQPGACVRRCPNPRP